MKKILAFVAIAAALCCVSCKKDNGGKNNNNNNNQEQNQNQEENKYVAPIAIDGDFADWAKLDESKTAVAKNEEGASHEALKVLKVYADEYYIFMYFEWDKEMVEHSESENVPLHVYINSDGKSDTGGFADQWSDACMDVMFEGFIYPGGTLGSYDPGAYTWEGEVNGSGWDDCWVDIDCASGLFLGAGVDGKYELQMTRELFPKGKIADVFSIGIDIQQDWDSVGVLPNAAEGTAPSLQVTTVK